jgi:Mg2+/Co2+ transporter CorB
MITEFFKNSYGVFSSKRLGYLLSIPFILIGTIWLCNKLINVGKPELAVEIWKFFYLFSAVLGGFVSMEVLPNIFLALNKKVKSKNNELSK